MENDSASSEEIEEQDVLEEEIDEESTEIQH